MRDDAHAISLDTTKAAVWTALAGLANVVTIAFGPGFFPAWYFLLVAVGYGLLLPAIAALHVRHQRLRESGAVLATSAGIGTITLGIAASEIFDLVIPALLVNGIWWWTIGKMWAETGVVARLFGAATLGVAVLALAAAVASGPMGWDTAPLWMYARLVVGLWSLGLAFFLWRTNQSGMSSGG